MSLLTRLRHGPTPAPATAGNVIPRRRRWLKGITIVVTGLALVVGLVFLAGPPIAKSLLEGKVAELLGRKVTVAAIRINPLALTVEVERLAIHEPASEARFVAFDRLHVDLDVASIYRRAPVVNAVLLEKPYVHVVRLPGRRFNFTDLIEKFAKDDEPDSPPATFAIENIRIVGGAVDMDDQPAGTQHRIRDLDLAIPFVSNLPHHGHLYVEPAFSARVNGAALALRGRSKPFSATRESVLDLKLQDVDVPFYWRYVPIDPPYRLASARLDVDAGLTFSQPAGGKPRISLAGRVTVRDLQVNDLDSRPLVGFRSLDVATDGIDVFGTRVPLKSVRLTGAAVDLRRAADGALNLLALSRTQREAPPANPSPAPEKNAASGPAREITVGALVVDAAVAFTDETVQPPFAAKLLPLAVNITGLSTAAGAAPATVSVTATTDAGESFSLQGRVGLDMPNWDLDATLDKLPLARYAPYYRDAVAFDMASGTISLAAHVAGASTPEGLALTITGAKAALGDLQLRRRGQPNAFLSLSRLDVTGGSIDLGKRQVVIDDILLAKPAVEGRRAKDGSVDLAKLTAPPRPAPASPPAATDAGTAWRVALKHVLLDQGTIRFLDDGPPTPVEVRLSPLRVEAHDIAIGQPGKSRLDLRTRINGKGETAIAGSFALDPLAADLKVKISDLDVPPFLPYVADRFNATLTRAAASAEGRLTLAVPGRGPVSVGYDGNALLAKLAVVDPSTAEDLLQWNSLFLDRLRVRTEPFSLDIGKVALTDFSARVQINADGSLNLQNLAGPTSAPSASPNASAKPADTMVVPAKSAAGAAPPSPASRSVRIDQVTLQGGTIHFSDRFIKPNVSATLTEVGGRVTGLLSEASTRADVDLRGRLSSQSPLAITGRINPLAGDLFADLEVSFRDIELPPFTPYAGKFAGYTIDKGKLTLELAYRIDKRRIDADNKVTIDQFTFGDKVDSPDATGLPVQLAVSLLKDREGRINLDVPVSGSLDDPKFKLGRVIWQVIVNLITKAVTAPFALIGSLFGGSGEELSYLDFAPGSATPDKTGETKLEQLGKALRDRPALRLDIVGRVNLGKDREALLRAAFERKVRAQKFNELSRRGQAPASVEATRVEPAEFERFLEKAYQQEKFPKPRNAFGFEKDLPREEMEKLMLANIVVSDDDLRQLAMQRAQRVKEALTASGGIASERIFLIEPKPRTAADADKPAASRAEFVLK